jgi:hypothetical protein
MAVSIAHRDGCSKILLLVISVWMVVLVIEVVVDSSGDAGFQLILLCSFWEYEDDTVDDVDDHLCM